LLTIIGTGIRRPQQLTLEGLGALRRARRVLHLTATEEPMRRLLAGLGVTGARCLDELYHHGGLDDDNYRRLTAEIVREVEQHEKVALLLYGHPRVGVTLTALLERALGDRVSVLPATSSFDTMINDLRRDPLEAGSVLVDANRLLLFELGIEPRLDYFIYHVDSVATRQTAHAGGNGSRWDLLRDYLLRFYPPDHEAIVVSSGIGPDEGAVLVRARLAELGSAADQMGQGASLFVPALRRKTFNRAFYSLLVESTPPPAAAITSD
jgi:uncharacterized protein YabN with tetrapyrrole methylase and pyrophosphatase domain